uniref:histidine kinase n=2 Tax=Pinguiococcus pyrenoidosus TaxID=172671 RepID=A0A7R9UD17_9STRA|mmetsp:Transcript_4299/g.16840  ORF Transcript_4299/g.16840 Transcript_4299/m.16840 type:complete len:590 (+) Transcript_4299:928-2697(+)
MDSPLKRRRTRESIPLLLRQDDRAIRAKRDAWCRTNFFVRFLTMGFVGRAEIFILGPLCCVSGGFGGTEKPLPMHSPLSWKDQLHAPDVRAAVDTFTKYVESAGKQPYSCIVHYKSGSSDELVSIWCRGVASIWKEDMSAVLQMAGTHTDVSHLTQQATSKLMRMTHEVRTPLASIVGAFDVLDRAGAARKLSDDGTVWDILRSSIKQLRIIVDDVVKLSQISSGSVHLCPTRASLRSIIGNILGVMHGRTQALGQTISVDYQTDPDRTFLVDVDHVNIVLVNLISNACKYSPQGADVKLICSRTEDIYSILVKDKGIGIAPEEHEAVFEEFSRGSNAARGCSDVLVGPSAGIGLALSRWIGLALGGNVVVDSSELDRGTSMEFTFRAVEAGAGEITPQPTEQDWKSGYSCEDPLLVVDDVRPNRLLAERYLRSYGFENVELAASGAEAVEKAKRTRYAICLIDIHMPGHDGFWVADRLREVGYKDFQIKLWTAAGDIDRVRIRSRTLGIDCFSKPLSPDAIQEITEVACKYGADTDSVGLGSGSQATAAESDHESNEECRSRPGLQIPRNAKRQKLPLFSLPMDDTLK